MAVTGTAQTQDEFQEVTGENAWDLEAFLLPEGGFSDTLPPQPQYVGGNFSIDSGVNTGIRQNVPSTSVNLGFGQPVAPSPTTTSHRLPREAEWNKIRELADQNLLQPMFEQYWMLKSDVLDLKQGYQRQRNEMDGLNKRLNDLSSAVEELTLTLQREVGYRNVLKTNVQKIDVKLTDVVSRINSLVGGRKHVRR